MPFFDFWSKKVAKWLPKTVGDRIFCRPRAATKTHPRRNLDFSLILGTVLVRRTPPGWRACQIIRINPVFSGIFRPPTPRHGQKSYSSKSVKISGFDFFSGITFRHLFPDTVFSSIFQFWEPFGIDFRYFFCIEFYMPFWMPFFDFRRKWSPKRVRGESPDRPKAHPKTFQKRTIYNSWIFHRCGEPFWWYIRDATSIFLGSCIDLGCRFDDIWRFWFFC